MEYIYHFDIAAIFIMLVMSGVYLSGRRLDTYRNRMMLGVLGTNFLCAFLDLINLFGPHSDFKYKLLILNISHTAYFASHILTVVLFYFYCNAFSGLRSQQSRAYRITVMMPAVLCMITACTNPIHRSLFTMDADCNYHRGPLIFVFYASALYYIVFALSCILSSRCEMGTARKMMCLMFIATTGLCVLIQFEFNNLLVENFGAALMLILVYIALENPGEYTSQKFNILNDKGFSILTEDRFTENKPFMVFCIKLHELKGLYKAYGKCCTDKLIHKIIKYMDTKYPRENFFRYSQSTFILVVSGADRTRFDKISAELSEKFSGTWQVDENDIRVKSSIGCAMCPSEINGSESLLDFVGAVKEFSSAYPDMMITADKAEVEKIRRRRKVSEIVSAAAEHGDFEVYYQPIISAADGRITSAEALVRLKNTELGYISPEEFIPVAEEQGSIIRLGEFVFRNVCRFMREKDILSKGVKYIEINLSAVQCLQSNLCDSLSKIMSSYDIRPSVINLEITETAEAVFNDTFKENIRELNDIGMTFSMDDYGTGYSNMDYLFELPFTIVKIDKTILWQSFESDRGMMILESIIGLAHNLGLEIVVEGVENESHAARMKELGCEHLQGFYYSKPVPESEFLALLEKQAV